MEGYLAQRNVSNVSAATATPRCCFFIAKMGDSLLKTILKGCEKR